jgi:DNA-directed RNA polymerase specialized sigma24 family protein
MGAHVEGLFGRTGLNKSFSSPTSETTAPARIGNMALDDPPSPPGKRLASATEARTAITRLGGSDFRRLGQIAKIRAAPIVGLGWEDLLNEALVRVLGGRRPWPLNVPIIAFIAQVMRSIASDYGRSAKATNLISGDADGKAAWERVPDEAPQADSALVARQSLDAIYGLFSDDADVLALLSGIECQETAAETTLRTGIGAKAYDAARKRFARGIERLVRQGRLQ